ncbi:tetratricopeptide repeat protein [Pelagibius marinus]|uniref:tetratricopeptide repeat protein n=1 Tax=Pelagibius marinus TaxID=2762760 RepID=UPI001872F52A|nr:tetratricopeptide repeat protein [Pelagibius marinus]
MTTRSIGRRLLRFAAVVAMAGFTVSCASSQEGMTTASAPAGFGSDPASRAERLLSYCDRLADKGELVTALGLCGRAHEINPEDPETLMKIASILHDLDRKQAAAQTYEVLLEMHPTHHEARYSLGKLYMETGETSLAAAHLNHAVKQQPEDPRPYNALGIIRDQAGEHEAAQALYRQALKFDPENHSLRNNLGLSLALNGQREEAIEVLAALAVGPEVDRTVLRNLEAAYTVRPVPGTAEEMPADVMTPASAAPDMPSPMPAVQPVKTKVLDPPAGRMGASEPLRRPLRPAPAAPAPMHSDEEGAPTPLYIPQPSTAGEPQQTGARRPAPAEPAAKQPSDVILAAAQELMMPPAWADFEPGALVGGDPPPDRQPGEELPPQNGEQAEPSEITVDPMELGSKFKRGGSSLSELVKTSIFADG